MPPPDTLVEAVVKYSHLLHEASSPHVAEWSPHFLDQCAEWCLAVESELMALPTDMREACRELAEQEQQQKEQAVPVPVSVPVPVPSLPFLLDALHYFYKTLLQNIYLSNDLYCYILKNYQFFGSTTRQEALVKDMTEMAHDAALQNVLHDMTRLLHG
ncbi:hypothetical protein EC973_001896 [Apophysomyces ossiformis]|uniref:Uncharacterized protein n=1 Tax=Apophysomyces ossiformis TaxID=679940 RepID=A0A8H7BJQ0_9FUNG|nr:hypothetical protein EC973_001896 [Apophysomyces ossiformis]